MSKDFKEISAIGVDDSNAHNESDRLCDMSAPMDCTLEIASTALKITSQPWNRLGRDTDIEIAASRDLETIVERLTSLFLIRIVAIVSHRDAINPNFRGSNFPRYSDISTTNICVETLKRNKPWPKPINLSLINQLRLFVRNILRKYNELHYHSFEHAYHVTISYNKLLDMMLVTNSATADIIAANSIMGTNSDVARKKTPTKNLRKSYGLKEDPLVILAALFSALVHDVEHRGISNRQLVMENDDLAILYNDQSPAEQRSLSVAFTELMKSEFKDMRNVLFSSPDEYRLFRKTVINLVLVTDIASHERTQLVKSKWKEAFGETKESKERKKRKKRRTMSRRSSDSSGGSQSTARTTFESKCFVQSPYPSRFSCKSHLDRKIQRQSHISALAGNNNQSRQPKGRVRHRRLSLIHDNSDSDDGDSSTVLNISQENLETEEDSTSATPESVDDIDSCSTTTESTDGLEPIISGNRKFFLSPPMLSKAKNDLPCIESDLNNGLHKSVTSKIRSNNASLDLNDQVSSLHWNELGLSKKNSIRLTQSQEALGTIFPTTQNLARASTHCGILSSRNNSIQKSLHSSDTLKATVLSRRFSSPDITANYSLRLSIRRSLDLNGEAIENYSMSSKTPGLTYTSNKKLTKILGGKGDKMEVDLDDPDELKATVVLEHLTRAADISVLLQGWEQMEKWSNRLFFELKANYDIGYGEDPQMKWFQNQITFLESYILPLARRLDDMRVFGDSIGPMFAEIVQQNRDRWLSDGQMVTARVVRKWQMFSKFSSQQ